MPMATDRYVNQVRLLVGVLPFIAVEPVFALKGGSAINLFHRNLPRLSVDVDLTYLPVQDRTTSLADIDETLDRIATAINDQGRFSARRIAGGGNADMRLQVSSGNVRIKIETSPVARGTVLAPNLMRVSDTVEEQFGFAEALVVSFEDLFAGKICAALDRQHPRDLFDVGLLYESKGMSDDLFRVFLVYAASSRRPLHELLNPNPMDLAEVFEKEFYGMTSQPIEPGDLEATRARMVADIQSRLSGNAANFLRSLHAAAPDFDLIGLAHAAGLPAVMWKTFNLERLQESDPKKYRKQTAALEELLD